MHQDIEGEEEGGEASVADTMVSAILQIAVIDLVFSIDSIITAVGMAEHVEVMIAAVAVAILVMYFASEPVAAFIEFLRSGTWGMPSAGLADESPD